MASKKLTLSIVIPVYNEERNLPACLDSILAQTVMPDEVIVVDNNSTDNSVKIAKSYSFVKVISQSKQGIVYARNTGFNVARSDIIGRIDGDIVLPSNWVERVKDFYKDEHNLDFALTGGGYPLNLRFPRVCCWLQRVIAFRLNKFLLGHNILFGSNMALPFMLWKKIATKACTDNSIHEDLDLAVHLNRLGYKIQYESSLRVSGRARRIITERDKLLYNLMMWPRTLKKHGIKTWFFGWLGASTLYFFSFIPLVLEYASRAIGRPPIKQ